MMLDVARLLQGAQCEGAASPGNKQKLPGEALIKRADADKLREIFLKYASMEKEGKKYMTYEDFVVRFLGLLPPADHDTQTLKLYGQFVDTKRNHRVSFEEFAALESLLCLPDAMYALAFAIFDNKGDGFVSYEEFRNVIQLTDHDRRIPFDFDSDFTLRHFGSQHRRKITYSEFTQTLYDFYEEHAIQAFIRLDEDKRGFITPDTFKDILVTLKPHLLTTFVQENIVSLMRGEKGGSSHVSYPYFTAFISLLNNMELVKKVFAVATHGNLHGELTKEEFLSEAINFTQLTPMEVDILYQLAGLRHQTGKMKYADIVACSPINEEKMPYHIRSQAVQETVQDMHAGKGRSVVLQIFENVYRFALGSIAGATGATAVYPIDLVKTRMQNQRSSTVGELMYKNSMDCFKKVLRFEGVRGLYRGLTPQLVGVAPEKAIKLTMNDLMRDKLTMADGSLPVWREAIAGGCGGASQVMFTNPLEIVKIRLQVAGELAENRKVSAGSVIKDLGFFGLYKGARACFLRDIPFSAIYFPFYAHNKKWFADAEGYNSMLSLLCAATLAGVPAAGLVTPADVIKTRLQVAARQGQTAYNGIFDCVRKIYAEEGGRAFWKGAVARVCRSSPQFGVTLLTYEGLQRYFYIDFGGRKPEGSHITTKPKDALPVNPDHIGGYRLACATFEGVESKLGLCFPKFKNPVANNPSGAASSG